jgi:hypothetical protein
MLISRARFFVFLFFFLPGPFVGQKLIWLVRSGSATGSVYFMGHTLNNDGSISSHQVIIFPLGKDSVTFNSNVNFHLPDNTTVPVRYAISNPYDARIDKFMSIWGDTLVYILSPLGIWLVLFLTPNRFDPLIPWRSKVQLRRRPPFIRVIGPASLEYAGPDKN